MTEYPEHDKLSEVKEQSQAIGEFVDWMLYEKGISLGRPHEHTEVCYEEHDCDEHSYDCSFMEPCTKQQTNICGFQSDQFQPWSGRIETLLAEFFGIDLEALDEEKRAMLEEIRAA